MKASIHMETLMIYKQIKLNTKFSVQQNYNLESWSVKTWKLEL